MKNMIQNYMNNLTREQVRDFALQNNVNFTESELDFTYEWVKKNWESVLRSPNSFDLNQYRSHFQENNFNKIQNLINIYHQKYSKFLNLF